MNTQRVIRRLPEWGVSTLALVLAVVLSIAAFPVHAQNRDLSDIAIADRVEDELLFDDVVPINEIDIEVDDGIAMLSGSVNNLLAKNRAERIAETVRGVTAVVNDIDVEPSVTRASEDIERDVRAALLADSATDSWEIATEVTDHTVILSGTVDSWQERQLAEKVAAGVRGVAGVNNTIEVNYDTDRPDPQVRADIRQGLRWNALIDAGLIDVDVQDGEVTLSGTVDSAAEKSRAQFEAWVAGVESVDASDLMVVADREDAETAPAEEPAEPMTDATIAAAVESALILEPRVDADGVTTEVADNTVTLRGEVDSLIAKREAARTARDVAGVDEVTNRLRVRPDEAEGLADATIEEAVEQALARDPYVERYELTVNVDDNIAYLYGTVDSYYEKAQADTIASEVLGVTDVNNNLRVEDTYDPQVYDPYVDDWYLYDYEWYDYTPTPTMESDAEIEEDINDQMWWSPFVDSDEVQVLVEDGVATLEGQVESWSEYHAATENAREGGARWVDNNLTVTW